MSSIKGAAKIDAAFRNIVRNLRVPLNEASRVSLRPMLAEAKALVPVETGALKSSLVIRQSGTPNPYGSRYVVGPSKSSRAVRYAHLLEWGTAPHWDGNGMHPGAAPRPFLTPAFMRTQAETIKLFGESIGPALEKRAAKLNAKLK